MKCVKKVFTQDKKECYELTQSDYNDFIFQDGWKISFELMKKIKNEENPIFSEFFFCPRCSNINNQRYTEVRESWFDLINLGKMDENYINSIEEFKTKVILKDGIKINPLGSIQGGLFKEIVFSIITFRDLLEIVHTPGITDNEARMVFATWDITIKEIIGMSQKDLNILTRDLSESFTKKYLSDNDIEILTDSLPRIGIDARCRKVFCKTCNSQIGGFVDFTNFFDFLFSRKRSQREPLRLVT